MRPTSLRSKLLLLMVIVVALPIVGAGYFMMVSAEDALVAEKQQKLFGAARLLDLHLTGDYEDILRRHGAQSASRETKIAVLNRELAKFTDEVARAYPGIGVGYYSRDLDAIITYGPSAVYADKVGLAIGDSHEGRLVMATGVPRVQEGELVRGAIMNAMYPIIRGGRVIGYIWANELTSDIAAQIGAMKRHIYLTVLFGLLLGIAGVVYVVKRLGSDIEAIKTGVLRLKHDLSEPVPVAGGEVGEIAAAINEMARELAERKKLEAQVQRAERLAAIGEVAAGLAHEIRNPLMAVKGFAQLLKEDITPAEQAEYSDIIVRETERLDRLIEQLLCFARPAATQVAPTDVKEVVESTLLLVDTKRRRSHIEIIRDLDGPLPPVLVDGEQLKQVLLNIILNAIQAIEQKGIIRVSAKPAADVLHLTVADTGCGIAPENMGKLFDPFFTTKENGTGLGLAVAHRLVENWNGRILVESTPGQGSTFTLVLPTTGGENRGDQQSHPDSGR
ncbi:ATP-binding protein [Sporolituus thermophilus]|uniref:histidine kinase n=1 Tax=Sporolituus thermophilus DSM 23256 TaxID=1123285 RepID=A0A1G7PJV1_9FIRM|nr:ATP-binding protein [Sporolituus thermophilus]SDF86513.1 two-component system, NtrC family, sensor histidine kinase HydH [Sporolituus thermophilus DSM 23256]